MIAKTKLQRSRFNLGSWSLRRYTFSLIAWSLLSGVAGANDIYVRLNSNPFSPPFYIFSSTENGVSEAVELSKGSTYVFIRTDSGHPFNIGSGWRMANPELVSSSTATGDAVSGVASIESGERLTVTIPESFSGSAVSYYCYPHSSMVATISVVNASAGLDTDSDGILNDTDTDDDGDGVSDLDEVTNGTDPLVSDSDNDGINDGADAFPLNPNETADTDSDGIGNNSDSDDDGDGLTDSEEAAYGTDPLVTDSDSDGFSDYDEVVEATDPLDGNSAPMGGLSLTLIKAFLDKQQAEQ